MAAWTPSSADQTGLARYGPRVEGIRRPGIVTSGLCTFIIFAVLLGTASASGRDPSAGPARAECALTPSEIVRVETAASGDSLKLSDGRQVQLAGILAVRPPHRAKTGRVWPLAEAAKARLARLTQGRRVELAFGARRMDRYGRLLAQVYMSEENGRRWVQSDLVGEGLARVASFSDNRACIAVLLERERATRSDRKGLWRYRSFAIRDASRPKPLLGLLQSFQIVEGRVVAGGEGSRWVYLNFGPNWRVDFTASIAKADRRVFREAGYDLKQLAGRRIRVRGWLSLRNGPAIRLTHPEQLELIDGKGEPPDVRQDEPPHKKDPADVARPGLIDL